MIAREADRNQFSDSAARITLMVVSLACFWAAIKVAVYDIPALGIPEATGLHALFDLRIRVPGRAHWWVPLYFLSWAAILASIAAYVVQNGSLQRHARIIATLGFVWCLVMLLNVDHAFGMPVHEELIINGTLTAIAFGISLLLALAPSNPLVYCMLYFVVLCDLIAGAWLLLWARFGSLPSRIKVDWQSYLSVAPDANPVIRDAAGLLTV